MTICTKRAQIEGDRGLATSVQVPVNCNSHCGAVSHHFYQEKKVVVFSLLMLFSLDNTACNQCKAASPGGERAVPPLRTVGSDKLFKEHTKNQWEEKSSSMWFVVNSKRKNTKWWLTVRADHSTCRNTRLLRVGPLLSKFLLVASNLTQRLKWAFLGMVVSKKTTVLILAYFSSINEVCPSFTLARKTVALCVLCWKPKPTSHKKHCKVPHPSLSG